MARTAQSLSSKLRARRNRREFERALRDASPTMASELFAASLRAESVR